MGRTAGRVKNGYLPSGAKGSIAAQAFAIDVVSGTEHVISFPKAVDRVTIWLTSLHDVGVNVLWAANDATTAVLTAALPTPAQQPTAGAGNGISAEGVGCLLLVPQVAAKAFGATTNPSAGNLHAVTIEVTNACAFWHFKFDVTGTARGQGACAAAPQE